MNDIEYLRKYLKDKDLDTALKRIRKRDTCSVYSG